MTQPDFSLAGKVALITGASRGIGEAIARCYAQAGATVILTARSDESLKDAVATIIQEGGQAMGIAAHSGDPAAVKKAIQNVESTFGGLDILVNNAATNPHYGPILAADDGVWDKILDINVKGYARWIRESAPLMDKRGGGKIINVASILGLGAGPSMGLYSVSKAAVLMLTEALAVELAQQNIQVNALAPGFIKTRFSSALWQDPAGETQLTQRIPQRRVGETEELTGLALFLASPASSFTTGSTFVCDGGHTAGRFKL
ncbi:MAG: glucose 1-dehydrogenase [Aliidiomarina sp.]|uniref:glucose 1-dehydrogenase n=1 Tax=Aliidiomarina sp. TaxID=1872439 RepID=UPI0025C4B121|nr:glucose 1-dehydrogenase [Aliidiomarina sp.]MCH8501196.1 glucose 1-dehydrogenase [Aliidiomarina sp.]